jgi:hypothetical protein
MSAPAVTELAVSELSDEQFLAIVADICAEEPSLTQVGAALLAAIHLGIANDSRTFSRIFGVAHALALREITELSAENAFLRIASRNARTQRSEIALTNKGQQLVSLFCRRPNPG